MRSLSIAVAYAGRTEDISRVGTGTQSAVIIGILELCLRHRAKSGARIFGVEEPEEFLHPQAQRKLARILKKIASENGSQVTLTTHSSAVVADTDILDIVRVDRDEQRRTRCLALPADYDRLDESQRILDVATAEMVFAERVALIEGPSERVLLSGISKLVPSKVGARTCDFDQLNISAVDVGGKGEFPKYAGLMDDLMIDWRIIADRDALDGNSLNAFLQRAEVTDADEFETKREKLLKVGVAVLSLGEIEDYYPDDALAELAGCGAGEVQGHIDQYREYLSAPEQADVFEAVTAANREAIGSTVGGPTKDELIGWMNDAKSSLRAQGKWPTKYRKTGKALENWLDVPRPIIARRVARWFWERPQEVPDKLQNLIRWVTAEQASVY